MKSMRRQVAKAAAILLILGSLSGCAAAVPMQPAEDATNPACAEIVVRLPEDIDGQERRETNAQGTGAWGEPAVVLLSCGVAVPGPSTLPCVSIDGVDWLVDDSTEGRGVFTSYGRDPAVQVVVDLVATSDSNALNALANSVGYSPVVGTCTAPEDATIDDDAVLSPSP